MKSEKATVEIELPRLLLRDFCESDLESVHEYGQLQEVVRYQAWGPNDEKGSRAFLESAISSAKAQPRMVFELAVVLKEFNQLIGGCGLFIRSSSPLTAEIGYTLNPKFWNKGYATEAARGIVNFGFNRLGIERFYATSRPENIGSIRVLKKLGFKQEKFLSGHVTMRGVKMDSVLLTLVHAGNLKRELAEND